jgi:hypothetical protein
VSTDRPVPSPAAAAALRPTPPPEVTAWAEDRAEARAHRDWQRADALKASIEGAGWRIEDAGRAWSLFPAVPPDVVVDGVTRYGSAASVPSVLADPPTAAATVAVVTEDDPGALLRLVRSVQDCAPAGTQMVIVGNDPDPAWDAPLAAAAGLAADGAAGDARGPHDVEVVRTSTRLGAAAAANAALRRARGAVIILAGPAVELTGDAVSPLIGALADPGVAVAGAFGSIATELPHLAESASSEPDTIGGAWLAFRRADYLRLGPLDERFGQPAFLDAWWSLSLRAGDDPGARPRRAVRMDLPLVRHQGDPGSAPAAQDPPAADAATRRGRQARRNGYRLLDRFRDRPDLLAARSAASAGAAGD